MVKLYFNSFKSYFIIIWFFICIYLNWLDFFLLEFSWRTKSNFSFFKKLSLIWTSNILLNLTLLTLLILLILLIFNMPSIFLFGFYSFVAYPYSLNLFFFNIFNIKENALLLNIINLYHPPLFYIIIIIILNMHYFIFHFYNYKKNWNFNNFNYLFFNKIVFLFLYLGSLWAFLEGTWGGWWNWDSSEILGLIFFLLSLFFFHCPNNFFYSKLIWLVKIYWINYFSLYYFIIQIGFNFTKHNFGIQTFAFNQINLFLLFLLFNLIFYTYFLFKYNVFKKILFTISNYKLNDFIFFFTFFLIIFIISLGPLLLYQFKLSFFFNNFHLWYYFFYIYLYYQIIFFMLKQNVSLIKIQIIFLFNFINFFFIQIIETRLVRLYFIHFLILLLILTCRLETIWTNSTTDILNLDILLTWSFSFYNNKLYILSYFWDYWYYSYNFFSSNLFNLNNMLVNNFFFFFTFNKFYLFLYWAFLLKFNFLVIFFWLILNDFINFKASSIFFLTNIFYC